MLGVTIRDSSGNGRSDGSREWIQKDLFSLFAIGCCPASVDGGGADSEENENERSRRKRKKKAESPFSFDRNWKEAEKCLRIVRALSGFWKLR